MLFSYYIRKEIIGSSRPAGVGPLSHGEVVEVEIENIGTLRNRVRDDCRVQPKV
ncbi:MAG: hypothetical protein R6U39_01150 [Candidatus Aegiribacteria sp.]